MTKQTRIILFSSYAFVGLLTEGFIFYLFPHTGLGGLTCYPVSIILCLVFGGIIYKSAKLFAKVWFVIILFLLFASVQFYIELLIHPQDFGGSAIQQLTDFKSAYQSYDDIAFNDFGKIGTAKRVAYIYKYKTRLPKSISILNIDTLPYDYNSKFNRRYILLNYSSDTIYNTTSLKIIKSDTSDIIVENPVDTLKRNIHLVNKFLLRGEESGYYDTSKATMYNILIDTLQFSTGIEDLFYSYLRLTKKPAANICLPK